MRFTVDMNQRRLVVLACAAALVITAGGAAALLLTAQSSLPPAGSARSTLTALEPGVLTGDVEAIRAAAGATSEEQASGILDSCADVSATDTQFDVFDELVPTSAHAYLAGASRSGAAARSACEVWISWDGEAWVASSKHTTASPTPLPTS
jgi:hypothetical protein